MQVLGCNGTPRIMHLPRAAVHYRSSDKPYAGRFPMEHPVFENKWGEAIKLK